ncbi:MAG: nucleoside deaminase [Cyclobacteriaceae bacterium]
MTVLSHEHFMVEALKEARKAFDAGEVPVGAVMICENRIIGRGYNQTERLKDATAHAEMIAVTSATSALGGKYLAGCTLYVTLEPCVMCAGALNWSQLPKLVYGASDVQRGYSVTGVPLLHPKTEVIKDVLAADCAELIRAFFKKIR